MFSPDMIRDRCEFSRHHLAFAMHRLPSRSAVSAFRPILAQDGRRGTMVMAKASPSMIETGGWKDALRQARLAEAAHFDAVLALRDAKSIRLQILKDDLAVIVAATPEARETFDLALVPGDPPRLWIDLVTSVIMEPDPRTYRLVQDSQSGRDVLLETGERAEMLERLKLLMAHRIIARERQMAPPASTMAVPAGYSLAALILAALGGFAAASIIVLGLFIYLKSFRF